jgi:hypothetical protein
VNVASTSRAVSAAIVRAGPAKKALVRHIRQEKAAGGSPGLPASAAMAVRDREALDRTRRVLSAHGAAEISVPGENGSDN